MHSLITIGSVGACDGVFDKDAADKKGVIRPIFNKDLDSLNPKTKIDFGASLVASIREDCSTVRTKCDDDCMQYYNPRNNDKYAECMADCNNYEQSCHNTCNKGFTQNCAVTVIKTIRPLFTGRVTNVSAIWLRTNWFLMTDSVLTDVLNGGLTMVSGGTYDQVINGYWALTRKSAFIGHTKRVIPTPQTRAPSTRKSLKCEANEGFCALKDEGISFPTENFSVYQRLYNIYDGPVYQETNVFLNIKKTPIDCKLKLVNLKAIAIAITCMVPAAGQPASPGPRSSPGNKVKDCNSAQCSHRLETAQRLLLPPAFYSATSTLTMWICVISLSFRCSMREPTMSMNKR